MSDKKRIITVVNTYYQLITAIRIKETLWANCLVDLVISDQSNNSNKIINKLNEMQYFDIVYWIHNKVLCGNSGDLAAMVTKSRLIVFGLNRKNHLGNNKYDELVYYNADIYTYGLFASLIKKNHELVCSRYEEGVLSYSDSLFLYNSRFRYIDKLRKRIFKNTLETQTKFFYCFYATLYKGKLRVKEIPKYEDYKIIGETLKLIFSIDSQMLNISEKYIFFTSVYDFEGGQPIGETELVLDIADLVGKNNLIVKMHPRDNRNVFQKYGIHVYNQSQIPWEAIQLNNDFSKKVFLTVNSGSVLGANMILKDKARSYFLYNCCDISHNNSAIATKHDIEKLFILSHDAVDGIEVIKDKERLREICF